MRTNRHLVKKCLIYLLVFSFSLYFFPDWEDYFTKKNNLDMLLYTKTVKYIFLITSFLLFFLNMKKLSILGTDSKKKEIKKEESLDSDLTELLEKEKLETRSEAIRRKNNIS